MPPKLPANPAIDLIRFVEAPSIRTTRIESSYRSGRDDTFVATRGAVLARSGCDCTPAGEITRTLCSALLPAGWSISDGEGSPRLRNGATLSARHIGQRPFRSSVTTPQLQQIHSSFSMLLLPLIYKAWSSYFQKYTCQRQLGKSLVFPKSSQEYASQQNAQMNGFGHHQGGISCSA